MAGRRCRQGCLEEFKRSNFYLEHDNPEHFVTSQWMNKSTGCRLVYVIYRVLVAVFWFIVLILSGVTDLGWYSPSEDGVLWFIYLTNWGLLILTLDTLCQAITSVYAFIKLSKWFRFDVQLQMVWYIKMQWIFSNIALCLGFFITIAAAVMFYSVTISLHFVDWASHMINSIYLLLNLFISATPIRVYHAIHTITLCLIYVVFSVILQYVANIHAYPGVYFNDPETLTISIFIGAILSVMLLWLFIYGLYRIRLAIAGCTHRRTSHTEQPVFPLHILNPHIRQNYYH